jgi:DNA-binding NarL/FixJ family response regulator
MAQAGVLGFGSAPGSGAVSRPLEEVSRMYLDWPRGETRPMSKTVLIVDDHPSFRASARRMLEADGYQVVGEAEDGAAAVVAVQRLRPELVLLDVRLPDIDGFEVAKSLLETNARPPQVVLTSSHDSTDMVDAIAASGVCGFIPKNELTASGFAALLT